MKDLSRFKGRRPTVLLLCLLILSACSDKPEKQSLQGEALGTTYHITYLGPQHPGLQAEIDSVFEAVNASMSTYLPDSDISRINRGDTTVVIDTMFREVMRLSNEIFTTTNGHFDPTVGVLVNAWGFGPGPAMPMDSAKVDSLKAFVGFQKLTITPDHRIRKENPAIQLDFNAIAKGYSIDRIAAVLDRNGYKDYLVEVGGELVGRGRNLVKEQDWMVGIDDPQAEMQRKLKRIVRLHDRALASSGNYRKFRIDSVSGRKYVHTIDPLTGFTKDSNVLAATVLADNCATADAYATAFMAMDMDESIKLLVSQKALEAYIIFLDEKGETQEFMTTGFRDVVVE